MADPLSASDADLHHEYMYRRWKVSGVAPLLCVDRPPSSTEQGIRGDYSALHRSRCCTDRLSGVEGKASLKIIPSYVHPFSALAEGDTVSV